MREEGSLVYRLVTSKRLSSLMAWINYDFPADKWLTPDKYHYSHVPVSGIVLDFYEIDGVYNSCNPGAVLAVNKAYSKNRRVVTIIDTDVRLGTGSL